MITARERRTLTSGAGVSIHACDGGVDFLMALEAGGVSISVYLTRRDIAALAEAIAQVQLPTAERAAA